MELTGGRLDHVVAHSAVRWWVKAGECDETTTTTLVPRGRMFDLSAEDFGNYACQLPRLHFEAARLMLPRLNDPSSTSRSTYTFVTGGERAAAAPAARIIAPAPVPTLQPRSSR